MTARGVRIVAIAVLASMLTTFLSGCWDDHELDAMVIITGVALDESSKPDQMDITLQIGETKQGAAGSGEANSQENSSMLMKVTSDTMLSGMMQLNRDSSHELLLHHNQVLLLGSSLAEQGVEKRMDLFLRDQQGRMEVPIVVVDGRAVDALSVQPEEDKISGIFLSRVLDEESAISPNYKVRVLDFASRLLDGTSSPVAPMVSVIKEGDQKGIKVSGMAVFKKDRMIGSLTNDEATGYVWSMGNVSNAVLEAGSGKGKATFRVASLGCKRAVTLKPDGGVSVSLSVEADLSIDELSGFDGMTPDELIPVLIRMAQDEIRKKITACFGAARRLDADIYGFGVAVYRKYPKEWRTMKGRWDKIFPKLDLDVQTKVKISGGGQIGPSLEMKGG